LIVGKNLYEILEVSLSTSQKQILDKYRFLVKQHYPDLHPRDIGAAEKMEQVNSAYDIFGNPEERKQYDA
jgi:curved DNA-binding protein CbpA